MRISFPYLRKQQNGQGTWIEVMADSMRAGKTTDKLDFAHDEEAKKELVERVVLQLNNL